jgi:SNF2 family DNA or RNA helicase
MMEPWKLELHTITPYAVSFVCWSKPVINRFSGGRLLADKMGLGKTISLILLNPKPE